MTRHAEFAADKANFLKLITDRDESGDVPVAIRVDLPHRYAAVMAPGVTDFDELRYACATFVQNWLGPEIDRLHAHLEWKASQT